MRGTIRITLALPRGCLEDLRQLLSDLKVTCIIRDERCSGKALDVSFHGELRPEQRLAAEAMLAHETGVSLRDNCLR